MKYLIEEFIGLNSIRVAIWLNDPRKWLSTIHYYTDHSGTVVRTEHRCSHCPYKIKEELPYLYDEEAILGKSFNEIRNLLDTYSIIYR